MSRMPRRSPSTSWSVGPQSTPDRRSGGLRGVQGVGRWCAAALLVCGDRYLMQLRDDKPGILLPDHWALFGGSIDDGEDAAAAMRRELLEELELQPRSIIPFTDMTVLLPLIPPRLARMSFF